MKRLLGIVAIALLARAGAGGNAPLPLMEQNALTTIDQLATPAQLDTAFGGDAQVGLETIAGDAGTDLGFRLRAIHGLVNYPGSTTQSALVALLDPNAATGPQILTVRAAIEALGQLGDKADRPNIEPFLDHNSRDIRAAAALALRDLGDPCAALALRTRLQHEASAQVQLAISAALRVLGQSTCLP